MVQERASERVVDSDRKLKNLTVLLAKCEKTLAGVANEIADLLDSLPENTNRIPKSYFIAAGLPTKSWLLIVDFWHGSKRAPCILSIDLLITFDPLRNEFGICDAKRLDQLQIASTAADLMELYKKGLAEWLIRPYLGRRRDHYRPSNLLKNRSGEIFEEIDIAHSLSSDRRVLKTVLWSIAILILALLTLINPKIGFR